MIKKTEIMTADGICDAYIAQPGEGTGPWPGVIFNMDAIGPRGTLGKMAERLAENGYVVLLANLFYRERRVPIVSGIEFPAKAADVPKILEQIMPLVQNYTVANGARDTAAFIRFLKEQPSVRPGKFGIFGYCMGGALALRAAAEFPDQFAAVASFHAGGLVTEAADSPHKLLEKIQAATYVGHADQDPYMTPEQIKTFNEAAAKMTARHETELHTGAQHHFTMPDLPVYNAAAAEKSWKKLLQLFKDSL